MSHVEVTTEAKADVFLSGELKTVSVILDIKARTDVD